jgi:hypothetical protein
MLREAGPFHADSCADGTVRITARWPKQDEHRCGECGKPGGPGLFTRAALAGAIVWLLNQEMKHGD